VFLAARVHWATIIRDRQAARTEIASALHFLQASSPAARVASLFAHLRRTPLRGDQRASAEAIEEG
jgi:hypothetical protein